MTTTHTTTTLTAWQIEWAEHLIKKITAWQKRVARWHAACDAMSAARGTAAEAAATAAWEKARRSAPSKASKYHAYDHCSWLVRTLNLSVPQPQSPADMDAVLVAARHAIAAAR